MFNLEGFIPKLCQLAQEVGDDERALLLRSAGLQALSSMVMLLCLFIVTSFLLNLLLHFRSKFINVSTSLSLLINTSKNQPTLIIFMKRFHLHKI